MAGCADQLFGGGPLKPRPRGRPKGSKTKPKSSPAAGEGFVADHSPPVSRAETPAGTRGTDPAVHAADALSRTDPALKDVEDFVMRELARLDFRALGTKSRTPVILVQDVSPSERPFEGHWVSGSKAAAEEIRRVVARNLIDVLHSSGDERFGLLSVTHAKDFVFPAGKIEHGRGTLGTPWLRGIRAAFTAYEAFLAKLGIGVREKSC